MNLGKVDHVTAIGYDLTTPFPGPDHNNKDVDQSVGEVVRALGRTTVYVCVS